MLKPPPPNSSSDLIPANVHHQRIQLVPLRLQLPLQLPYLVQSLQTNLLQCFHLLPQPRHLPRVPRVRHHVTVLHHQTVDLLTVLLLKAFHALRMFREQLRSDVLVVGELGA